MYLELNTKFYEIILRKEFIYIHYGKIPNFNKGLPFGSFRKYFFADKIKQKNFYNKKINEKLKKGYKIIKKDITYDMKEMIKMY